MKFIGDVVKQLCDASNTLNYLGKTTAAIEYERKHKTHKCYKCGKYGHIAEHCGKLCRMCKVMHPFEFCLRAQLRGLENLLKKLYNFSNKVDQELQSGSLKTVSKIYEGYLREQKKNNEIAQATKRAIAAAVSKLKFEQARFTSFMAKTVDNANSKIKALLEEDVQSKSMAAINAVKYKNADNEIYFCKAMLQNISCLEERTYCAIKGSTESIKFLDTKPLMHKHITAKYNAQKLVNLYKQYDDLAGYTGRNKVATAIQECSECYKAAVIVLNEEINRKLEYQEQLQNNNKNFSLRLQQQIRESIANTIRCGLEKLNDVTYLIKDTKPDLKLIDKMAKKDIEKIKMKCAAYRKEKKNRNLKKADKDSSLIKAENENNGPKVPELPAGFKSSQEDKGSVKMNETDSSSHHKFNVIKEDLEKKMAKSDEQSQVEVPLKVQEGTMCDNVYSIDDFLN